MRPTRAAFLTMMAERGFSCRRYHRGMKVSLPSTDVAKALAEECLASGLSVWIEGTILEIFHFPREPRDAKLTS